MAVKKKQRITSKTPKKRQRVPVFDKSWFEVSPYPEDFYPEGVEIIKGVDFTNGITCFVIGFKEDGDIYIQSVDYHDIIEWTEEDGSEEEPTNNQ